MDQFKSFSRFVDKINHYGMQSGIIKVVPPKEWLVAPGFLLCRSCWSDLPFF